MASLKLAWTSGSLKGYLEGFSAWFVGKFVGTLWDGLYHWSLASRRNGAMPKPIIGLIGHFALLVTHCYQTPSLLDCPFLWVAWLLICSKN